MSLKQSCKIMETLEFEKLRNSMVDQQLVDQGVRAPLVLQAMRDIPRDRFVSNELSALAYENSPLPIGEGQTISQPFIVALMTEALKLTGSESVLEVGTGSGYAAAILGRIARQVFTIERIHALAVQAQNNLKNLELDNVSLVEGDGTLGYPQAAPYDAIVVAASGPVVPDALKSQLKIGGRLVIPVGSEPNNQRLRRITRVSNSEYADEDLEAVRFVPLIGAQGWPQ